jgi:hypothetical protein
MIAMVLIGFLALQPLTNKTAEATAVSQAGGTARAVGCYVGAEVAHPNWVAYYNNEGAIGQTLQTPPGENETTVNDFGMSIDGPGLYDHSGSGPSMGDDTFGPLVYPLEGNRTQSFNVSDNSLTPKRWMQDPTQVSWTLTSNESWSFKDSSGTRWFGYGWWKFEGAQFFYNGRWHAIPATYPYHHFKAPHGASIPWYRVCASWVTIVPAVPMGTSSLGMDHRDVRAFVQTLAPGGFAFGWVYWFGGSIVLGLLTWFVIVRPRRRHRALRSA